MHPHQKITQQLLQNNLRIDGRQPLQQRMRSVLFLKQKGHLVFNQGNTKVIIKSKAEITSPKNERPSQGFIFFRVDCTTCNKGFQEQRKLSTQLGKLLQTIIVGSKALDPESLCILSGRFVWKVNIQCLVFTDDGNIFDSILNGVTISLMDLRKPLIKFDKDKLTVEEKVEQSFSLAHIPVSITLALTQNNLIADPSLYQELIASSRVTVAMNIYKQICSIHKPGGQSISEQTLSGCIKLAQQRVKKSTQWMRQVTKERPLLEDSL